MKALNCKLGVIFLLLIFGGTTLFAKEVTKTLKKEFKTNSSTVISFETKFSELTVETWNKNQASFDITIVVENEDEAKAKKMLELLNVEFKEDGNTISLETVLDEKFNKTNWGKTNKMKFIINAKIPSSVGFELDSNLGKVIIGDLAGSVEIHNNLGSMAINSLTGESELELNNSDVRLGKVGSAEIEMNNGELNIESIKDLEIDVNLGKCYITRALNVEANVNMGDLDITEVGADFESLDFQINTGKVTVGVNKAAGFSFNATATMAELDYPKLDKVEKNKKSMGQNVEGTHGNGKSSIDVTATMGSFTMKFK